MSSLQPTLNHSTIQCLHHRYQEIKENGGKKEKEKKNRTKSVMNKYHSVKKHELDQASHDM